MTEKSSKDGISRRDFVAATGAAAAVGGAASSGWDSGICCTIKRNLPHGCGDSR